MRSTRMPASAVAVCAALLVSLPLTFGSASASALLPTYNPYTDRTYFDVQEYAGPAFAGAGTGVSISGDGRFTVFDSVDKLTADAVGDAKHVYRRSTADGSVQLVSTHVRSDGENGASFGASVSADGRFVTFTTIDRNVLPTDPGPAQQVVLKDMQTGAVTWVSSRRSAAAAEQEAVNNGRSSSAVISADGKHVAFVSTVPGVNNVGGPTTSVGNIEVFDVSTGDVTNVSSGITDAGTLVPSHGLSAQPALSADGRFVVFTSDADNLGVAATTPPPGTPAGARHNHIYRLDRTTGTKKLVSVSNGDTLADLTKTDGDSYQPSISADGSVVGFLSTATNLLPTGELAKTSHFADAYLRDMGSGATHRVSLMLNDVASPDHADSTGTLPSTMRTRYWREAVGGASGITVSADGRSAVLTSISPLVWIDGECRSCQKFVDDNDALDVYKVTLGVDGRPADMQPISVRRNTQDGTVIWQQSNTAAGDSQADGPSPMTTDGSTVVFGSLADNLRGWDSSRLVLAGDMTFALQKPYDPFGGPDPRQGQLMEVPHYLDGGFPGSSTPRVRMFLSAANAFAIRLLVPARVQNALAEHPETHVDYETRHAVLPALAEQPAQLAARSALATSAVSSAETNVTYALTVTAQTAGSAIVTFAFDGLDLQAEDSIPAGWSRAKDDVAHTLTYTSAHLNAGDSRILSLQLRQNDVDHPSTVRVLAEANGTRSTASASVRPPAPACHTPSSRQNVVAGIATIIRDAQCLAPGATLSVAADHGSANISSTGVVTSTPDAAYRGDSTLSVVATDAFGRRSAATALTVTVVAPALAVDDRYATPSGSELVVDAAHGLLSNDVFPTERSGWRINEGNPPGHGTLVIDDATGAFRFTPEPGYTGPVTFRYQAQARDAGTTNTGTVTIDVR